ncbi:glycosyl hydrolase 115 family protein [Sphingobacterium gobiense]|uniref:Glycosyhydrolase n=1 Tax=Sphingobacterium gobiense TaxID=1382456 RepID=A0A2S9JND5_9SPHI|nr:glycosyl hydrolase 115 family protein [Sphingobacterium gobiense]PRD54616.1 glycosyhydrolase [Sphingobacterium gobiense]
MKQSLILFFLLFIVYKSNSQSSDLRFVFREFQSGYLPLIEKGKPLPIHVDPNDDKGVLRAVESLQRDFEKVAGIRSETTPGIKRALWIGTVGQSSLIDGLLENGLLNRKEVEGKREKFIITVVNNPTADLESALVIAGSEKRGTIYGIYELAKQMGVSPWHYWADVPVERAKNLYVKPGVYTEGEPAVKYRGIFLNDEYPALTRWANHAFGGYNSQFYEKVFELLLRLKGNFLWPAMWGSAFYDDDPQNGVLADEMGIVMSTSHHEPMARAQAEWKRHGNGGEWDYSKNKKGLQEFWRGGMERAKNWETFVTIAMRGDGDEPMSDEQNTSLLEEIVKDQRKIIEQVTGKKAEHTPQVWALYKEVQDYYDDGMRVPDDVTLLFCDDNWGNVRKLPALDAKPRKGGYGMYYHFDYVGGPRNTKWLNVSQVSRVWEQMNLTYEHGVDKIWVVNVGDLKPMEYPISFFLDMAWNPKHFNPGNLLAHTEGWCAQQFGEQYAKEAARLIDLYTKFNHRVTPELLNHKTFSLENYNEFESVANAYRALLVDAMRLYNQLPSAYKDAFDQLVLFPINGMSNLYDMYYAKAKNDFYAAKGDVRANYWADKVKEGFERDSLLTLHFNTLSHGKWKHMMDQVRIGYTSWNNPPHSIMPKITYVDTASITPNSKVYVEEDGYIAIEAMNFHKANNSPTVQWTELPNLGKTESAITTLPVTAPLDEQVYLEYKIDIKSTGEAKLIVLTSPTLNYNANKGLRYAVSINGGKEQILNINGHYKGELGKWQANRIIENVTTHRFDKKGEHTIRIRPLEHGIVIQKIMLDLGGLKPTYLGPPQSAKK